MLALEQLDSRKVNFNNDPIPRQALSWLSAYTTVFSQIGNVEKLRRLMPELESRLTRTMHRGRQDEFARSYLRGLTALDRDDEIAPFVRRYQSVRRDNSPFPSDLNAGRPD